MTFKRSRDLILGVVMLLVSGFYLFFALQIKTRPILTPAYAGAQRMPVLLGILLAFVLEFLDDSLKTAEDVEGKLRLAVLGIIPKLGPKENIASVAGDPRSSFSEAYRSVRTAL